MTICTYASCQLTRSPENNGGRDAHQAFFHRVWGRIVDSVLATRREEGSLLHLVGPDAFRNSDHPEELVNIVARIAEQSAENDKDVVHLMLAHNLIADFLSRAHGLANCGDMCVVPGVVVHERRPIGHATNLVAVVPPRHDLGILLGVLSKPLIRFSIIVNDVWGAIREATGQHDRWRRVRI
jgi:hypothetical protein